METVVSRSKPLCAAEAGASPTRTSSQHWHAKKIFLGVTMAAALTLAFAGTASAHVEPSPSEVQAGSTQTVAFTVEHGCGESPLTQVEMQLPAGLTAVSVPETPQGWTGTVTDSVVTFQGGPQPAHEEIEFAIQATFPDAAGTMLGFPTIETCEQGTVEWIQPVVSGEEEPEFPAPTVTLTPGVAVTAAEGNAVAPESSAAAEGAEPSVGKNESDSEEASTTKAAETSDASSTNFLPYALIGLIGGAALVIAVTMMRKRKAADTPPAE
ncbi:MAG: DUF1775 domain-containing protein [Actinobacteria bacterium]|nr:DUF1775 domain-containing protein [Actinomycetota bacterium]MSY22814.1 DUF1775 domain-containing protein [Actinomycetota bacterium]